MVSEDYYDSLTNYHIRKAIISYVNGTQNIMDFYAHYIEEVVAYGHSLDKILSIKLFGKKETLPEALLCGP